MGDGCHEPDYPALLDRPRPRRRHAERDHAHLGVLPESRRSTLVTAMFCGFTVGSAFGGFAAAGLIANYGWQSVLILGGVLPILLTPFVWIMLPESVRFLVLKNAPAERITAALHKIAPKRISATRATRAYRNRRARPLANCSNLASSLERCSSGAGSS